MSISDVTRSPRIQNRPSDPRRRPQKDRMGSKYPHEVWRDVVGLEGYYEVSSLGRVRSLDRYLECADGSIRLYRGKIRKPQMSPTGQPRSYVLQVPGKRRAAEPQVLVAEAFLGPRPEGHLVKHLDNNLRNNTPENLAYWPASRLRHDVVSRGKDGWASRTRCIHGHLLRDPNLCYRSAHLGRTCLACRKGRSWAINRGTPWDSEEARIRTDGYYLQIMQGTGVL